MPARRCALVGDDEGMTLVELIVAMTILVIFFSVFSSIAVRVFDTTRRQQTRSLTVDVSRNVVQVLDRQVRYANVINTPATTADGTRWVEWRSGSIGKQQSCHQWRLLTSGLMQYRSWQPPLSGSAVPLPTGWTTVGSGIGPRGSTAVFDLGSSVATTANRTRQQLTLTFLAGKDNAKDGAPTTVTFTALNTLTPFAPITPVCQEVPRS